MQHPPKPTWVVRPRIPEFPEGLWRIVWLGGLRPTQISNNPVGYDVRVHLAWMGEGQRDLEARWTPLGNLLFLRIQSIWSNGEFSAHPPGRSLWIRGVDVASAQKRQPWSPGRPPHEHLISRSDYDLFKIQDLASCWVLQASDAELIVPVWEVLRVWYLFDMRIMPAMLAGALVRTDSLAEELRLWLPGTGQINDQRQYVRPHWMSDRQALRLAQILFSQPAASEAYTLYRHLMTAKEQNRPPWLSPIVFPALKPPMLLSGCTIGDWRVRAQALQGNAGRPRYLVQSLDQYDGPEPFDNLHVTSERDRGEHRDDLEEVTAQGRARIDPRTGDVLPIAGVAPDPKLSGILVEGFDFHDGIVDKVKIHRIDKPIQVARFTHLPSEPVVAKAVGIEAAGRPRSGVAGVVIDDSQPPQSAEDVLKESLAAFEAIIAAPPPGWTARLMAKPSMRTFPVTSVQEPKLTRHFAILEIYDGKRYAYVLEAQRLENKLYGFCIGCHVSGVALMPDYLAGWLCRFPAKSGHPWTGDNLAPQIYRDPSRVPHQKDAESPAATVQQLAERLVRRVSKFLEQGFADKGSYSRPK